MFRLNAARRDSTGARQTPDVLARVINEAQFDQSSPRLPNEIVPIRITVRARRAPLFGREIEIIRDQPVQVPWLNGSRERIQAMQKPSFNLALRRQI
jgi:hypothetical protein